MLTILATAAIVSGIAAGPPPGHAIVCNADTAKRVILGFQPPGIRGMSVGMPLEKIWKNLHRAHSGLVSPFGSCNGESGGALPSMKSPT
jgi:hypothetical protein